MRLDTVHQLQCPRPIQIEPLIFKIDMSPNFEPRLSWEGPHFWTCQVSVFKFQKFNRTSYIPTLSISHTRTPNSQTFKLRWCGCSDVHIVCQDFLTYSLKLPSIITCPVAATAFNWQRTERFRTCRATASNLYVNSSCDRDWRARHSRYKKIEGSTNQWL